MHAHFVSKENLIVMFIAKIRLHWQAFIIYKNGENLKILAEIFRAKLISLKREPRLYVNQATEH